MNKGTNSFILRSVLSAKCIIIYFCTFYTRDKKTTYDDLFGEKEIFNSAPHKTLQGRNWNKFNSAKTQNTSSGHCLELI